MTSEEVIVGAPLGILFFAALLLVLKARKSVKSSGEAHLAVPYMGSAILLVIIGNAASYLIGETIGVPMVLDTSAKVLCTMRYNWHVLIVALSVYFCLLMLYGAWALLTQKKQPPKRAHVRQERNIYAPALSCSMQQSPRLEHGAYTSSWSSNYPK